MARRAIGPAIILLSLSVLIWLVIWPIVRVYVWPMVWFRLSQRTFDAIAWKQARSSDVSQRLRMAENLLARYELRGMSRAQVIELLGKPDGEDDSILVYLLGPERYGFGVDSEWLSLRLDSRGRVTDYQVSRD